MEFFRNLSTEKQVKTPVEIMFTTLLLTVLTMLLNFYE